MDKLFLLDAYALIFRAYYAFIKNPRINSKGENTSAILGFVNTLEEVLAKEQPTHIGVAFDPAGGTFRHEAYPEYKAQREATPESIRFAVPHIKEILAAYHIPVLEVAGFEADDVIGTLASQADAKQIRTYLMTPDKDYGQLVTENVCIYRPSIGKNGAEIMGPEQVMAKWGLSHPSQVIDMLGLMGDASDNIPGCPGVGEKTAMKLIQDFGSVENLLAQTDQLKGALQKKVTENTEQIRLSKWLATISTEVPVTLDMEALAIQEPDKERLKALFEDLEFRALTQKMFAPQPAATKKNSMPIQGDLFEGFGTESTTAVELPTEEEPEAETLLCYDAEKTAYRMADTPEERQALMQVLMQAKAVSMDTETTGTEALDARLVGMSFAVEEGEAWYVPVVQDESIVEEFRPFYECPDILKVGQNIKYDLQVLRNYGIRLAGPMADTMIAHYLLHPEMRHGMDYLAEAYLRYRTIPITELIGSGKQQKSMADLSPEEIRVYACEDADITLRLHHLFLPQLKEQNLLPLFEDLEMPLVAVLAEMERNGVCLDTAALHETSGKFTRLMEELEKEIHALAGMEFNIASPKQVGEVLFDRLQITSKPKKTKTGQYVTSEDVLESLRSKHPIVEKILEHRGVKKLLGTYVDALPLLINPRTGHIHTNFNQTITTTGRLSSSNPNLQNIPVRDAMGKEVRKAFVSCPGELFFSADYSQIELRIMAHLSQDANLIDAFMQGHDIHTATAAKIFKKELSEVTADERRKAKTANFGIIYGISAFGLAERMGVSRTEAKQLIDEYFITYPGVKAYMDRSIAMAREEGFTTTLWQRRCYLPDINSHNATVRGYAERNAINAPIQGTAADIIKVAMVRIHKRMQAEGVQSRMILQVHDELNFSVPPHEKETIQRIVIEEMQAAAQLRVPLIADCGWGENWLEAH
ncbi:MAG: DNA polymerase I [Bacteroidaceae bacterium]|nr:DNA polymerase I [Bacteroidaceae bacterium]